MQALLGIGWTQHLGIQGSCHKDVCATFDLLLEVIFLFTINKHVHVKDSIAEGTCSCINKPATGVMRELVQKTKFLVCYG